MGGIESNFAVKKRMRRRYQKITRMKISADDELRAAFNTMLFADFCRVLADKYAVKERIFFKDE